MPESSQIRCRPRLTTCRGRLRRLFVSLDSGLRRCVDSSPLIMLEKGERKKFCSTTVEESTMQDTNIIGIDLAKRTFQVCVIDKQNRVVFNKAMSREKLTEYLARQAPARVVLEACGSAHYWGRLAASLGHQVKLLSPRQVTPYRQGHKTDARDALAIARAGQCEELPGVGLMSVAQQSLQSQKRVEEHLTDQKTATGNMLRGLLAEFGVVVPQGEAALRRELPCILEDAENGVPLSLRSMLALAWQLWQRQAVALQAAERNLAERVQATPACQSLLKLAGVGDKNALGLYIALGDGQQYQNGRAAAACIGLTPKQHSSGGKVRLGSIGKRSGDKRLRASLITGAHAVLKALAKRSPRNDLEAWLKTLVAQRGPGRAAVALANKTVRTAWAMLRYQTEYDPDRVTAEARARLAALPATA